MAGHAFPGGTGRRDFQTGTVLTSGLNYPTMTGPGGVREPPPLLKTAFHDNFFFLDCFFSRPISLFLRSAPKYSFCLSSVRTIESNKQSLYTDLSPFSLLSYLLFPRTSIISPPEWELRTIINNKIYVFIPTHCPDFFDPISRMYDNIFCLWCVASGLEKSDKFIPNIFSENYRI